MSTRRALLVAVFALAIAFGPGPRPAAAQVGERITRYDTLVTVEENGDLVVEETIDYDFGTSARHGIYRDIQVRYDYDERYERVYPVKVELVRAAPGTPAGFVVETEGRLLRIRIGDPDRTITGRHTYIVRYRVSRALNAFGDHDELYWNTPSPEWGVPISGVTTRVVAPGPIQKVACFSGPRESRLPCASATADGAAATFTHPALGPYEGMSVVAGFAKGLVPPPSPKLDERWSVGRAFAVTPLTASVSLALLLLLVGVILRAGWTQGRDRRFQGSPVDVAFGNESGSEELVPLFERPLTPVEFAPPDNLRPGQIGTLVDEVANPLDVTATVVDLAVRGYLRIEEIPKEGWLGKPDWKLVELKGSEGLLPYEALLRDALFASGPEVLLSDLKDRFADKLAKVQDALYADAVAAGWFPARPDKIRVRWIAAGIGVLVLGVALTAVAAATTHLGLIPIPVAIAGIVLLASANRMPRRTAIGTGTLRRALGFKRFIDESERERAQFAERQHLFSEYLPYAVVFGATERWARAFAGLDGSLPATGGWYVSPHPFTMGGFSRQMDSFATVAAGTIASTPSSSGSSGFGGGGFSGGGGGGGGGGSW